MILRNRKNSKNSEKRSKTEKTQIKYDMSLKARLVMEGAFILTMVFAPILFVITMVVVAWEALWGAFIEMPMEVKERILNEYLNTGIAKKRVDLTTEA